MLLMARSERSTKGLSVSEMEMAPRHGSVSTRGRMVMRAFADSCRSSTLTGM